jgi:hypothetical protein
MTPYHHSLSDVAMAEVQFADGSIRTAWETADEQRASASDSYLGFAKRIGMVPPDGTKQSTSSFPLRDAFESDGHVAGPGP